MAMPSQEEFSKAMSWQADRMGSAKSGGKMLEAMGMGGGKAGASTAPKALSGLLKSIGKRMGAGLGTVAMMALLYYLYKQTTKAPQGIPPQMPMPETMPATQEVPTQSFDQRAMGL